MTPRLPYAVVVTDLDGTLLLPDGGISAPSREVLQLLSERGVEVVLATGRHHCDGAAILRGLELPRPGYLIAANGSRVHRIAGAASPGKAAGCAAMELLLQRNMDADVVCDLLQLLPADEEEISVNIFQGDEWRSSLDWSDQLELYKLSGFRYSLVRPLDLVAQYWRYLEREGTEAGGASSQNPLSAVEKLAFGSDNTERLHALERVIVAMYGTRTEVAFSSACCLDVCPLGAAKANAVQELVARLPSNGAQLSMADCLAFGDGMNDLKLLQLAGKGCLMGNAHPRLKEALPQLEVIGRNTEDGVAKKLREIFNL
ncbi:hydrolase [Trypanosoma conorhini]|uniref:Hydrolase n=1 Tax=Trypanosoma conorhini TaxID=83891 RepID=A0A3R7KRV9_9TRYP|nr:hydrolase [Trypanosoma conorhini]RNF00119.1 hydrolase [Trypanosoma conorhini]